MDNRELGVHNQEIFKTALPKARKKCDDCKNPVCVCQKLGCSSGSVILECFVLAGGVGPIREPIQES